MIVGAIVDLLNAFGKLPFDVYTKIQYVILALNHFCFIFAIKIVMVVVVLLDHFRGMGAWRNSTEIQQSGHAPRSGLEVIKK